MSDRERKPMAFMTQEDMTREIYMRIVGDGTEANPGLDKRVDRLENKMNIFQWVSGSAAATGIGIVITWAMGRFRGGA
jgi:hypothetical protein